MKVSHLLYRSYTHLHFNPKQVERIFEVSKKNNERDGLSGILLYRAKMFVQLIEGHETDVMKCFNRIRLDTRHFGAGIMLKLESDKALFPSYNMAHIADERPLRPFNNIEIVVEATGGGGKPGKSSILQIVKMFSDPEQLLVKDKNAA